MTENKPLNHKLDTSKIKTLKDVRNVFECMNLISNAGEDHPDYELLKEYFTIPCEESKLIFQEPHKSLEEHSQELNEKIDKLIEDTKRKFYGSKIYAESKYERKFDGIFDNFEYARKNGIFPLKYTLDGSFFISNSKSSPSFVIKNGSTHQGYYTIGEDKYYRFYMEKTPNIVFRWFMRQLMGFKWIDDKY